MRRRRAVGVGGWSFRVSTGVVLAGTLGCWPAQDEWSRHQAEAARRLEAARVELAGLSDHEWAGEYRTRSDFVGDRIVLAPATGCVSDPWTDVPVVGGSMNAGEVVKVSDDVIRVEFVLPRRLHDEGSQQAELVRIRWGERRYLVWRDRLPYFRDELGRPTGADGQFGSAMLHEADVGKPFGSLEDLVNRVDREIEGN